MDEADYVEAILVNKFNYKVKKIKEINDIKTPDYSVEDGNNLYHIEVKTKQPSVEELEDRTSKLKDKPFLYEKQTSVSHCNTISGIVNKAKNQLRFRPDNREIINLVWFHLIGHGVEENFYKIKCTLYGLKYILVSNKNNNPYECYYYTNSRFYRDKDILDGAIISSSNSLNLCLNNHSSKYGLLKKSHFKQQFGKNYYDPIELHELQQIFVVDGDIDRSNKAEINKHLANKYKVNKVFDFPMKLISVESVI